jgi:hypothetical protein
MHLSDILAVIGIAVGVIAVVVGVLAARRWGNRRRKLLFEFRATPLIPPTASDPQGLLKVTFRDFEVPDPHLVTILLRNVSPADIATDHFDAGRPLVIRLNCQMYGITATTHRDATASTAVGADGVISMGPLLLRTGESVVIEAVVSGAGAPELDSPLVDTDVVRESPNRRIVGERALGVMSSVAASVVETVVGIDRR